jgi:very-short-patch-repair endonuclease
MSSDDEESQDNINKLVKNYKHYQDKLLQITQRNRSVLLKKIYNKHNFDLTKLDEFKEGIVDKVTTKTIKNINTTLNDKRDDGASLNILLDSITDNDDADSARHKLKTLARNLKQIEEETGQQTGYLGFPFLQGHPKSDPEFYIRGPLILFPISLQYKKQAKNGGWFCHIADKRPILNGALIAALKKKGGYTLPEDYEETFDDLIEDISTITGDNSKEIFFNKVNDWIKKIITLNEANNQSQTTPLQPLTKNDIEQLKNEPLHLINYKIIGNFPQADNEIYRDYNTLIQDANLSDSEIIGELVDIDQPDNIESFDTPNDDTQVKIDDTKDRELNLVLSSDSSQDEVILESKNSDLVVVRGPPGTGKSQVIVNLIADALTNKKRILVVCQKRAALEVVKQRLGQVNLDRYVVFLEKELDDRVRMYQQLHGIIEEIPSPLPSDLTIDEISYKIDKRVQYLSNLGISLRKGYFGGATAHKLYSKSDGQYRTALDLSSVELKLDWKDLDDYIQNIKNIEDIFKRLEDENHPWFGRNDFSTLGLMDKNKIRDYIDKLIILAPKCVLASTSTDQSNLSSLFDTCLNNPGFLGMKKRGAAKKIGQILKNKSTNDDFFAENFDKVKLGIEFWSIFSNLLALFNDAKQHKLQSLVTHSSLVSYLSEMQNSFSEFDIMQELDKKKTEYHTSIFQILNQANMKFDHNDNWADRIKQEIYAYWLSKIEQENPILKGDPISNYQINKRELAQFMDKKQEIVQSTIQRNIEGVIHPGDMYGRNRTTEQKEWRAFAKELKKKRKVKPVRKLFESYGSYLFQIAPCWLASPESVSKIFPLQRQLFDLVIVDEASQLAVERAIPFLYRAKNVVIAGDEKQLPPFDLFQIKEDDDIEYEDEDITDEKSLLDLARTKYKTINLNWHYRSQYQDLINFSNHAFYQGLLNVAPNAINDPQHPPIQWIKCNGMWENQTNHVEATKVVNVIKDVWDGKLSQDGTYPSIGVITFNEKQQVLINDIIDKRIRDDPEFSILYTSAHEGKGKDDQLFIKNIENVQGDERDVIIFSIGYAKDADGNFKNFFGSLSRKGGENRLNVAVTRARQEMIVITSIESSDIKPTSKYDGPKRLRQFLEYAKMTSSLDKSGQKAVLAEINPDMERISESRKLEFDSDFEIQVYDKLRERGFIVDSQVGFSGYKIDLAIVHPHDKNRHILGIECDGATFHSAKSVKERDVMRQKFLEGKGWIIERIWSRNWWRNPTHEIDRIVDRVDELAKKKVSI